MLKAKLVADYFDTWSTILLPTIKSHDKKFLYIDFFAGPGRYEDGTMSTPLLVMEKALKHPDKRKMLVSIFNDQDPEYLNKLKNNIEQLEGYKYLHYEPIFTNICLDPDSNNIDELKLLAETELIPTLFFIDPFGYQGLSLTLIHSVLKDWGSDGIFFFNYRRINSAISNKKMQPHMEILFGKELLKKLRMEVKGLAPRQRERLILDYLIDAIKDIGGKYVLDFRFPKYGGDRTSHYLIFVSKHIKGYRAIKDILASNSNSDIQGVASFEYDPSINYTSNSPLPGFDGPLDILETMLIAHFRGRRLSMYDIYDEHDQGDITTRYYTKANYKQALLKLEKRGQIKVDHPPSKRIKAGKITLGDNRTIKFIS